MPINPKLQAETEQQEIDNYREAFRTMAKQIIDGGRLFANLAFTKEHQVQHVESADSKRGPLTKVTGISEGVAQAVHKMLIEKLGFEMLGKEKFNPSDVAPEIDHAKAAKGLHVVKRA